VTETSKPEESGHTKYGVECDPKKKPEPGTKVATDGCPDCGGKHEDVDDGSDD
jgi:hypothetical protein